MSTISILLNRHCERSKAIQSIDQSLWIAASPTAPRNDGVKGLRIFAPSREKFPSFCLTRSREGTKKVSLGGIVG